MKKTLLAALAVAGIATAGNVKAQSLTAGDAMLYFFVPSSSPTSTVGYGTNVCIDLGDLSTQYNLSASALSALLGGTYGSSWATSVNLNVGVMKATSSNVKESYQDGNAPYYSFQLGNIASFQNRAISAFNNGTLSFVNDGTNNHAASVLDITQGAGLAANFSLLDDWTLGNSLNGWNGNVSGEVSSTLQVLAGTELALYNYSAQSTDGQNVVGTVTISTGGDIAVVPEPSTYALIALGSLIFVIAYRRKVRA